MGSQGLCLTCKDEGATIYIYYLPLRGVAHLLFASLTGWGLIRYMQDEVLHSQLLLFPGVLQPLKSILGEHSLIFSQPDLE